MCMLTLSASASAQICATLAVDDGLPENERSAALSLVESELQVRGIGEPGALDCDEILTVRHILLGGAYNVVIEGPAGTYRASTASAAGLADVYTELVGLAMNGSGVLAERIVETNLIAAMEEEPPPQPEAAPPVLYQLPDGWRIDPTSGQVVSSQSGASAQVEQPTGRSGPGRDFGYFRLGAGLVVANGKALTGPAIGFGWRHYEGHLAVDASVANAVVLRDVATGFTMGVISMNFYYVPQPEAASSAYLGGGLTWGIVGDLCTDFSTDFDDDRCYRGDGLQFEIGGGYEFLRHSSIRLATHLNVSLPLGQASATNQWGDPRDADGTYVPTGTLSILLGFGGRCLDCGE